MLNFKNNKGVTLVALSISIIIIGIILTVIVFSSKNSIVMRDLNNMYADIKILEDKISIYYLDYNELPIGGRLPNSQVNKMLNDISKNPNNYKNGSLKKFYEIDTSKLLNINLNNQENGKYAINEQSHAIYYIAGVEVDDVTYYTIPKDYINVDLLKLQN